MPDKEIWEHLSKELAKTSTVLDLSQRLMESVLFKSARYNLFTDTILDSFTRIIFLSIYNFFDRKYSWSLYSMIGLSSTENIEIQKLLSLSQKYINVRNEEIGHSSKKIKFENFKRLQWLPNEELEKIKGLLKEISRFLNSYGMRNFNEGYSFYYGGIDTSLQCLIEDLEEVEKTLRG